MTKHLVRISMAIMTTLLALVVLWQFRTVVIYVLISLTLASAMRPLIKKMIGKNLLVKMAWLLLYLMVFGSLVFLLFTVFDYAVRDIQQLSLTLSEKDEWILPIWMKGSAFQLDLIDRIPPPSILLNAIAGEQGQLVLPRILGLSQDIGGILSGTLVILFLSIYWTINQIHFERLWLSLLPSNQRTEARGIWRTIEPDIGAYIRGQFIQSAISGVLLSLGFWALGSPYPVMLGLIGALLCLVPVLGAPLALIPPLMIGLLTGAQVSLFTTLYAFLVLIAISIWVRPRLFKRQWDNPILTVVLLIAMADAFGLIGIIIAPPLSAVCQILWSRLVSHREESGAASQISDLKERQEKLRVMIGAMEGTPLPLVTSSIERLSDLIDKAEPILEVSLDSEPAAQIFSNAPPKSGQQ